MQVRRLFNINFLPLWILIILTIFLAKGLFLRPQEIPSVLVGKSLPYFDLPVLEALARNSKNSKVPINQKRLTNADLRNKVVLLNVWATWCSACNIEHDFLLNLSKSESYILVGLNYKDSPEGAIAWLAKNKSPYKYNLVDITGEFGLDLGVYGTPEMYIIDKQGKIRYKHAGIVDQDVWQQKIWPVLQEIS